MSKRLVHRRLGDGQTKENQAKAKAKIESAFGAIDGSHPWQSIVSEGCILYPVRALNRGEIAYFNFPLAKEMGLIPEDHPHRLNAHLVKTILATFSVQIVNEYDQENRKWLLRDKKENAYMATRYLQLQHSNKQGKTSGDGRSIWNGCFRHKGKTWDISSRGTGVTSLAPGAVEANRPLKTGAGEFGYGCGLADIDELVSSALMSEIFHRNGVSTERVLTVIDLGKGEGIGVRAALNLLRPAHLFLWLKQEKIEPLKRATDYFIRRQIENRSNENWNFQPEAQNRYDLMLQAVADDFAHFAATLERQYIFAWLDWDGDNVLASAGIIDYGSVRQFGLRHDQYRYDDVDRFSTNLNEQRGKARLTVQVFAQLTDYLKTGVRKPLRTFGRHPVLKQFDQRFELQLRFLFLQQVGFDDNQAQTLLKKFARPVERLYQSFSDLERQKTKSKTKKVADGINRPAIFKMRAILRELPAILEKHENLKEGDVLLTAEEMLTLMAAADARRRDLVVTGQLQRRLSAFQHAYVSVVSLARSEETSSQFMEKFAQRAQAENKAGRITGNSAEYLVHEILTSRKRGLSNIDVQKALDLFIQQQTTQYPRQRQVTIPVDLSSPAGRLFQNLLQIALEHEEDI